MRAPPAASRHPRALPSPPPPCFPSPQADAEVVDQKPRIEKECHSSCTGQWGKYEACVKRITAKGSGSCEPWAFDYWTCVDKCTAPRLFAILK